MALAGPNGAKARLCRYSGSRDMVRLKTTEEALEWLIEAAKQACRGEEKDSR
jgi:hypothetical protein